MAFLALQSREVFDVAGVGEFVEVVDLVLGVAFEHETDKVGADETCAACYEDAFLPYIICPC
jgi:uncharacterized protein YkvS